MSIVKMKKLSVIAPRSEKDALLKELMLLGCVELSQAEAPEDISPRGRRAGRRSGGTSRPASSGRWRCWTSTPR